jgi:RNA polymerase sigma factor (sigma-70 family)
MEDPNLKHVKAYLKGDDTGMTRLYLANHHLVRNAITATLVKRGAGMYYADGIESEVWRRVSTHLHTFKGDSLFTTWLYRVIQNSIINELSRSSNQLLCDLSMHTEDACDDNNLSARANSSDSDATTEAEVVENNLQVNELILLEEFVNRAKEVMKPEELLVYELHDQGLLHKEISHETGFPIDYVKKIFKRCKIKILRKIKEGSIYYDPDNQY